MGVLQQGRSMDLPVDRVSHEDGQHSYGHGKYWRRSEETGSWREWVLE
jgi:hypothetical protein